MPFTTQTHVVPEASHSLGMSQHLAPAQPKREPQSNRHNVR